MPERLFFASKSFVSDTVANFVLTFSQMMSFYVLHVSFGQI